MKNKFVISEGFVSVCKVVSIFLFFNVVVCSCYASGKKGTLPYFVDGKINVDSENSKICSVDLLFRNKSDKVVVEYTAVFFLFDSEGEIYSKYNNNVVLAINSKIQPDEVFECEVNLDEYFATDCGDSFSLDYLYVSQIKYEDGTVWKDPYGLLAY